MTQNFDKIQAQLDQYNQIKSELLESIFDDKDIDADEKWRRLLIIEDNKLLPFADYMSDFERRISSLLIDKNNKKLFEKIVSDSTRSPSRYKEISLVRRLEYLDDDDATLSIVWEWIKTSKFIGFKYDW